MLPLNKTQLDELEKFHLENMKSTQSLPTRTARTVVYLLLGALPVESRTGKTAIRITLLGYKKRKPNLTKAMEASN